jgi:membrane protein implicated in regulation of membrane protease activity
MLWLWGVLAAVAVGAEMITGTFYFALVGVGAIAGLGSAALGVPPLGQAAVMAGVSLAGILLVRPFAVRHFARMPLPSRTGVDALPGAEAVALTSITAEAGQIRLKGEVWSARLDPDLGTDPIPVSGRVSVTRIDGATALVFPLD